MKSPLNSSSVRNIQSSSLWIPTWRTQPMALQLVSPLKHPLVSSNFYTHQRALSTNETVKTMAYQKSLPRLPVPPLYETIQKYLRYLQPLVSANDFQHAKKLIEKFMESNDADKLQQFLVQRSKSTENWLSEWWLYNAYLNYREPVVVNSNPGVLGSRQTFADENAWLNWCAKLICGSLDFKAILDRQRLPVDKLGGEALCMMQYYSILSSCRIPGEQQDSVVCYRHDVARSEPIQHIVVVYRNHYHSLQVLNESGYALSLDEIFEGLKHIVSLCDELGDAPPLGLMTAQHRDIWAPTYRRLTQNSQNLHSFSQIHKAFFLLCLDQPVFNRQGDPNVLCAANMLFGGGADLNSPNRWFDKTLQLIVSRDGACGLNYEHAPAEGPPIISVLDHALSWIRRYDQDASLRESVHSRRQQSSKNNATVCLTGHKARVTQLPFVLDQQTQNQFENAKENLSKLVGNVDLFYLDFQDFGKDAIKREKLSPDAFIQVALQLAYYRLYAKTCATYESGSTRKFQLGRTDTIRSCSNETLAFSQAMQNVDDSTTWEKRLELMVEAISQHKRYTGEVIRGQGFDRHLLGLKLAAKECGIAIPKFLSDPTYSSALHFQLSTSQVAAKNNVTMCFGAVVPDGYGACYNPQDQRITIAFSSYHNDPHTSSQKLAESMTGALRDMYDLLTSTRGSTTPAAAAGGVPQAKL